MNALESAAVARGPTTSRPPAPGPKRAVLNARVIAPCLVLVGFLAAWTFVSRVLLDPDRRFLLPTPASVLENGLLNREAFSEILQALASTAEVALAGLALAIALGVLIGILMS